MSKQATIDALRRQILTSMGLVGLSGVALACGGRKVGDDTNAGVTIADEADDMQASDEGEGSGSSGASETSTPTSSETEGVDDCTVEYFATGSLEPHQDACALPLTGIFDCPNLFYMACTPAIGDQSCAEQCPEGVCMACLDAPNVANAFGSCGPLEIEGMCCAILGYEDDCTDNSTEGRPFVAAGRSRVASLDPRDSESRDSDSRDSDSRDSDSRDSDSRDSDSHDSSDEFLATHWSRVAAAEHASIASFAQFAMHLVAHAAPPELIRDALAAAADEVRHAELARDLAARHRGRALEFGPLDVRGAAEPLELRALVRACIDEGCIGETLGALELALAAERCTDPRLAADLRGLAVDEARHAALAWRFVAWALARAPELTDELAPILARRRVAGGFDQLVRPCAEALLHASGRVMAA